MDSAINKVLASGNFIKGTTLDKFEKEFAKFIGVKYCIGVASGTDALHLSLLALNIGKGDEVILPVNTFIATVYAILYTGAKPVFVDIKEQTYNIDVNAIENKLTKKTKVILPVHLYGQPAEMDKIINLSKKYNLAIIEDACQAHGAKYNGKLVGSIGDFASFSFYPAKNLGAYGDGGAITTNSAILAKRLQRLREYGAVNKYTYKEIGLNSRLDTLQAAILLVKLKHLNTWNKKRSALANYYTKKISQHLPFIKTPFINHDSTSAHHLYVIRTSRRNQLAKYLLSKNIQVGIHYPLPLHLQKSLYFLNYKKGSFPVAESVCSEILSLPLYPELTQSEQDYTINSIINFFKH